jgi:phosphoribosylformylglycinamidine cyclo-ligase
VTTYEDAGVSLSLGDKASALMYEAARQTWENRKGRLGEVLVPFDDFSGLRAMDVSQLPSGSWMNMGFDGVGTKMEVAERVGDLRTLAFDLFAMVCDDAVIRGAEPVLIGSILDVNSLQGVDGDHIFAIEQLAEGYVKAAKEAGVAVVNGEIAELGSRVGGFGDFCSNWGASVVWFARQQRLLTGREVKPGDTVLGLKEEGFRSNGLSLARKVLQEQYGAAWHCESFGETTLGQLVLHPSRIYTRPLVAMTGGFADEPRATLHAAAHITGGGLPGKLGRALKASGLGARLDSPMQPNALMKHLQELVGIRDAEAYRTWNMGQGMVLVSPEPEAVEAVASELGFECQRLGEVIEEPHIQILSQGALQPGQWLEFGLDGEEVV